MIDQSFRHTDYGAWSAQDIAHLPGVAFALPAVRFALGIARAHRLDVAQEDVHGRERLVLAQASIQSLAIGIIAETWIGREPLDAVGSSPFRLAQFVCCNAHGVEPLISVHAVTAVVAQAFLIDHLNPAHPHASSFSPPPPES